MISDEDILVAMRAAARAAWHAGHGRLDHDDCVSEANEAVALAMLTYDASKGSSLSTYAANRARWQARKRLDAARRNHCRPIEWFDHVLCWPAAPLHEMFEGTELHVVTLWLIHGFTYREIADHMGVSCFRVFGIMQRVKKKMAESELPKSVQNNAVGRVS